MIPFRYIIYGLSLAATTLVYSLRLAFNSTILCQFTANDTDHYLHDPIQRGWMFSSVSLGLLLGLLPLPALHTLGTRNVVLLYNIVGCVAAFIYPWSDSLGFWPSFIVRTIQGAPNAVLLWMVNNVSLEWAPKGEIGLAIAIVSSTYQVAPIIAMITAGEMCTGVGWEFTYYLLSTVTLVVTTAFFLLYSDNVQDNRFTSAEEKKLIVEGKAEHSSKSAKVPYQSLFQDSQVWLVWFMYYSFFVGLYVFLQYGPTYINQVLHFDIRSTGYASALPYVFTLIFKLFYGPLLDDCCGLKQNTRMKLGFASVELLCAVSLLSLVLTSSVSVGLMVYVIFNSLHGLAVVVIMKQAQLIAKQHAHVLVNGNTLIVAVCIFTVPLVVNWVVPNNSAEEWSNLFIGVALQMICSVFSFICFSSSTPSEWTELVLMEKSDSQLLRL